MEVVLPARDVPTFHLEVQRAFVYLLAKPSLMHNTQPLGFRLGCAPSTTFITIDMYTLESGFRLGCAPSTTHHNN